MGDRALRQNRITAGALTDSDPLPRSHDGHPRRGGAGRGGAGRGGAGRGDVRLVPQERLC